MKGARIDDARTRDRNRLTLDLIDKARETLFSQENVDASRLLDPLVRSLPFFGAANFFHQMGGAVNQNREFSLNKFFARLNARANLTNAAFRFKYVVTPKDKRLGRHQDKDLTPEWLIKVYDNEVFIARWALHILSSAFGLDMQPNNDEQHAGNEEQEGEVVVHEGVQRVTFTPYNGPGSTKRFSWTLGKAILLASQDLRNLTYF